MKPAELVEMDNEALQGKLKDSRRELYELRFRLAVGQLDDHRQIRNVRLDIARIMTSLRQRELGISVDPGVGDPITAAPAGAAAKAQSGGADDEQEEVAKTSPAAGKAAQSTAKPTGRAPGKTTTRGKAVTKTVTRRVGKTISKTAKAASKTVGRPKKTAAIKSEVAKKAAIKKTTEETE